MISSESSTISGLRRSSTPSAPVAKRKPETAKYQATLGPSTDSSLGAPPGQTTGMGAEDDPADRGDQQHDRGDLEGEQVVGQKEPSDLRGTAEGAADVLGVREPSARLQTDYDHDLHEQR